MNINLQKIQIKETTTEDFDSIMEVQKTGFGYDKEAKLTAGLLHDKSAEPHLSLLAIYNGEAIGHILFTKARIEGNNENPLVHILAPLAVKPAYQKKGIGGLLIKKGLEILKERGSKMVFVLGHKEYYPKYGFLPNAEGMGFIKPFPDGFPEAYADYWMLQALSDESISPGKVICSDALNKPEHWREDENDR